MYDQLQRDLDQLKNLLGELTELAGAYSRKVNHFPAAVDPPSLPSQHLPLEGWGAGRVLHHFKTTVAPFLSGSSGPRYLGFVTGGVTPAALIGDWLVSVYDQNVVSDIDSIASQVETQTIAMLRELFKLSGDFQGAFVSGATMSNFAAFVHRTPQNSRRFRAVPAWFSMLAYGKVGYEEIVARCCRLALSNWRTRSEDLEIIQASLLSAAGG